MEGTKEAEVIVTCEDSGDAGLREPGSSSPSAWLNLPQRHGGVTDWCTSQASERMFY